MIPNQLFGLLNQLRQNPMQFLIQRRFNVPQGVPMNDPQAILNHLVQSGQVSQEVVNNAYRFAQTYK